mmetsp:Transcript_19063/g.36419  ORF Transcript_19063/g.36419 Transcript_19063/m.36419 type:complete len:640 (+) Transcript_19063:53-1972(+)|eukprot:CAMPEP_0114245334 /NCGR_PEP_ID=MMETSP0058-20121206/11835_1 /TAXON_ID=36894 /ORGANISM="Pyramimonas parkeae, CCMP726" /LENGTH=639 /DNA_ID=CAMNT_0001358369 /DNA_START=37 /DNA_END=1956 /DNA_ORIENTATION=-
MAKGLEDRLQARWAKKGGGPQIEARLKAMQDELRRREDEERAKCRGVAVPTSKATASSSTSPPISSSTPITPSIPPQRQPQAGSEPPSDSEEEEQKPPPKSKPEPEPELDEIGQLKQAGNEALAAGDYELAAQLYTEALAPDGEGNRAMDSEVAAALYNNRALARLKMRQWMPASTDASAAASLSPAWPKPCFRLAQAQCELGSYKLAVATARRGEKLAEQAGDHSRPFESLLDHIAHVAALNGSLAGFDGRFLEVRSAGEDAWLCKPAPADPLIDDTAGEDGEEMQTLSILEYGKTSTAGPPTGADRVEAANLAVAKLQEHEKAITVGGKPRSFRSLKLAVEAAKDGDRILMLRGIHNFSGESVDIKKRIYIRGEGELREMMVDQRSNSPSFRIYRTCVIQNIEVDMSGFRECCLVEGPATVQPVVDHCMLRCSGDDAINVSGAAVPTFRDCELIGRKCGLKVMDNARGEFIDCKFSTCNQMGVRAHDQARPTLRRCHIEGNIEEGVVVMDQAHVELIDCHIRDNKGPGIDISDGGAVTMRNCWVKNNCGGVFMWDESRASLFNVRINGGLSHAILADGDAVVRMKNCKVQGVIQATDTSWQGIRNGTNQIIEPEEPTQLPAEEGPFKFEADRYTRKQ